MNRPAEGAAAAPPAGASALYSRSQAYAVLAAMVLFTLCLDLAKLPINVMVDPIRRTLGISDVQISLLLGAVGAAPFVVMSLVGGWLSDRLSRRLLLAVAIAVWTLGAVICAHATSFEMLVAGRVLVHVGAGMKLPLAMTWVNDAFPPEQRGRAVGAFFVVLGSGPSLAIMLAGAVQRAAEGGAFAAWPGLAGAEPWRATTALLGIPGLLMLPLILGLQDRRHVAAAGAGGQAPAEPSHAAFPLGLIATLVTAAALIILVDGANLAWMATVFKRNFGYDAQQAGFAFGLVTLLAGALGPLIGGWIGDSLYRRHGAVGRVWLACAATLCCVPLLAAYLVQVPAWLTLALTLNGICTVAALSITYVNAQALLPDGIRGLGTGLISATTAIVGSAGPTLVALSSQHLLDGPMALPRSIALVGACGSLLAALVLAAGALALARSPSVRAGTGGPA
jgi:MFS family permease